MRRAGVAVRRLRALGGAGAALCAALAFAGPCAADVHVRPLAKGAFRKLDAGPATLDLPPGVEVRPC